MRWKEYAELDHRIVRRFLLFPKNLDGETRWLEWATFEQVLEEEYIGEWGEGVMWVWKDKHWVDEEWI